MTDITAGGMEFRAGRVVARSFSTLFRNIAPFGLLALVLTSPTYLYTILALQSGQLGSEEFATSFGVGTVVLNVIEFFLGYLVTAALVYGTVQDLRGRKVDIGACFTQGLARMFPVLGVALVTAIVYAVAALPLILSAFLPLAFPLLLIPLAMVVVMLWATIPVAVIERRGIGSLARSSELTKGFRWRIFFVIIILIFVVIGMSLLGGVAIGLVAIGGGEFDVLGSGAMVIQWMLSALISSFMAVVYAVSYHDLRVAKEGVDTDQIAAVFD